MDWFVFFAVCPTLSPTKPEVGSSKDERNWNAIYCFALLCFAFPIATDAIKRFSDRAPAASEFDWVGHSSNKQCTMLRCRSNSLTTWDSWRDFSCPAFVMGATDVARSIDWLIVQATSSEGQVFRDRRVYLNGKGPERRDSCIAVDNDNDNNVRGNRQCSSLQTSWRLGSSSGGGGRGGNH